MSYSHNNQYRCTIIRGKAKNDLDNLLPAYAQILYRITPIKKELFPEEFNKSLGSFMPDAEKKTLDNHRTEIAGKLFGIYYEDSGTIFLSDRAKKFLNDYDQPAFFKDMCYRFQFPNGMDKIQTLLDRIEHGIKIRPLCFVVKLVIDAYDKYNMVLSQNEIGYYALNNLDVLSGKASVDEVIAQIKDDRQHNILRKISYPGKAESYCIQHIREQLNYLELANLIRVNNRNVFPNLKERKAIKILSESVYDIGFNYLKYDLQDKDSEAKFYSDWQKYYSNVTVDEAKQFSTSVEALEYNVDATGKQVATAFAIDTTALGDDGEALVCSYEKRRVSQYDKRLVGRIIPLGKIKGLGYDIQSVFANEGDNPEFAKYIEVKSTKRVTAPDENDSEWVDVINVTRNEWMAAQQYQNSYEIYRVYFTQVGPKIFIIKNPYRKNEDGIVQTIPTMFRIEFSNDAVDKAVAIG